MRERVTISVEVDAESIIQTINDSLKLKDDHAVFEKLASLQEIAVQLKEANELFKKLDGEVKAAINNKAKALFGPDWSVLDGERFKITRSGTGAVYDFAVSPEDVPSEFVKVERKPNSEAIEGYVKAHSALPKGIEYNPMRGEQLRITLKRGES